MPGEIVSFWMRFLKIPELFSLPAAPSSLAPKAPRWVHGGDTQVLCGKYSEFGLAQVWNQQHQFFKVSIFHHKINTQISMVNVSGLLSMRLDQKHPLSGAFREVK